MDYRGATGNVRQNDVDSRRTDVVLLRTGDRSHARADCPVEGGGHKWQSASDRREDAPCGRGCLWLPGSRCCAEGGGKLSAGLSRSPGTTRNERNSDEDSARGIGKVVENLDGTGTRSVRCRSGTANQTRWF